MNISFESSIHNIYNPKFSSEGGSRALSSIERSVYEDYEPLEVERISSDSSNPSVAEERDTITVTPNVATPNLSRIMNLHSISKIEEHTSTTYDFQKSPSSPNSRKPKSSLSIGKKLFSKNSRGVLKKNMIKKPQTALKPGSRASQHIIVSHNAQL